MNKKISLTVIIILLVIGSVSSQNIRPRNRSIYGSYSILTAKYDHQTFKSDYAASLMVGRTFFFHKTPIYENYWIGLDWTVLDLSMAHYKKFTELSETIFNQMGAGTHIGPSFWYSPVNGLSLNYYFRIAPTFSWVKFKTGGDNFTGYSKYWVTGVSFSYKLFAMGVEYKWGSTDDSKMKTHGPGFYIGVRLW